MYNNQFTDGENTAHRQRAKWNHFFERGLACFFQRGFNSGAARYREGIWTKLWWAEIDGDLEIEVRDRALDAHGGLPVHPVSVPHEEADAGANA